MTLDVEQFWNDGPAGNRNISVAETGPLILGFRVRFPQGLHSVINSSDKRMVAAGEGSSWKL